jgi:hypothetical protein
MLSPRDELEDPDALAARAPEAPHLYCISHASVQKQPLKKLASRSMPKPQIKQMQG